VIGGSPTLSCRSGDYWLGGRGPRQGERPANGNDLAPSAWRNSGRVGVKAAHDFFTWDGKGAFRFYGQQVYFVGKYQGSIRSHF